MKYYLLTLVTCLLVCCSQFATCKSLKTPTDARVASFTCPATVVFSYSATGNVNVLVTNEGTSITAVMTMCNGDSLRVSALTANVPTSNLRFVEKLTSNGNVHAGSGYIPEIDRAPTDQGISYFNRSYGPYTLLNPSISGVLSETFTPYIDENNNQQYDPATECLGMPAVLIYVISNTITTVKSGYWNDPTIWSCGTIPNLGTPVIVAHSVVVPDQLIAQAKQIAYTTQGRLLFWGTGQLQLGNESCSVPITADPLTVLTQNTWQINEHRSLRNNVMYYYKRGAVGNTGDYDNNSVIRFNLDGTGTYTNGPDPNIPNNIIWYFDNPSRTKLVIDVQGLVLVWENINFSQNSFKCTEYYTLEGTISFSEVKRGIR